MNLLKTLAAATAIAALAGCTTTPQFQTGPDAEVTYDGLTKLDKTILDDVWARTDIDLSGYDKVMLQGIGVEFRPVTGPYSGRAGASSVRANTGSRTEFQLDEKTKAIVIEEISAAFSEELARSKVFEIVDEPGPDVLNLHVGLLDVVSQVPPDTVGRSEILLSSVGEATIVMELRDSVSNAILVRAVDRRAAESAGGAIPIRSNSVTNRTEVRRLGRRWANIVRGGLESAISGN
jgi:hypothetical protein